MGLGGSPDKSPTGAAEEKNSFTFPCHPIPLGDGAAPKVFSPRSKPPPSAEKPTFAEERLREDLAQVKVRIECIPYSMSFRTAFLVL